ncbi:MAG: hypothetical protein IPJ30_10725 [Acidobacteria bacterium]|nr:hypothetical protein [Acidobacteriota bacterium]
MAEPPVTLVGVFSNVESNGEHQWGYTIEIWRQQDRYFGLVFGDDAPRAVGDGPRASIENAVFDPGSNRLHLRRGWIMRLAGLMSSTGGSRKEA